MTSPSYTLSVLRNGTDSAVVELRWYRAIDEPMATEINRCLDRRGVELLHNPVGPGWLLRRGARHTLCAEGPVGELKLAVPDVFSDVHPLHRVAG